jgi:hypothetical protein
MAIPAKALVYGGREGSGAAQIFDTSGASKWEKAKIDKQAEIKAKEQERQKEFNEQLEFKINKEAPWGKDQQVYTDLINGLIEEAADIKMRARTARTPEERAKVNKEYVEWQKKEAFSEVFAKSSLQSKDRYYKTSNLVEKNDADYKKQESFEILNDFKQAGGIEYNSGVDDPEEIARKIVNYRTSMDSLSVPKVSWDMLEDFINPGIEYVDKRSKEYKTTTKAEPGEYIDVSGKRYYKKDALNAAYMQLGKISDNPVKVQRLTKTLETMGLLPDDFDGLNEREKGETLVETSALLMVLKDKEEVKKRISRDNTWGGGYTAENIVTPMDINVTRAMTPKSREALNKIQPALREQVEKWVGGLKSDAAFLGQNVPGVKSGAFTASKGIHYLASGNEDIYESIATGGGFRGERESVRAEIAAKFKTGKKRGRYLTEDDLEKLRKGEYDTENIEFEEWGLVTAAYAEGSGKAQFRSLRKNMQSNIFTRPEEVDKIYEGLKTEFKNRYYPTTYQSQGGGQSGNNWEDYED